MVRLFFYQYTFLFRNFKFFCKIRDLNGELNQNFVYVSFTHVSKFSLHHRHDLFVLLLLLQVGELVRKRFDFGVSFLESSGHFCQRRVQLDDPVFFCADVALQDLHQAS